MTASRKKSPVAPPVVPAAGSRFFRLLAVIAGGGLLLRLLAAAEMMLANGGQNNSLTPSVSGDLATYMRLASEIASGQFPPEFYYQPWYYSVFLVPVFFCFSGAAAVICLTLLQALLSTVTIWFTGLVGRRLFGDTAGLLAAGAAAISSPLLLYVPFAQNETLQTFHLIFLFWLLLVTVERPRPLGWAVVGAVVGIAILTRGNIWLLLPVFAGALALWARRHRVSRRRLTAAVAAFTAALLLVQLPFIWRNTAARGRLTGPSTAGDAVLALGNSPEAPAGGREPELQAGAMYYPESYHRMMALASGPAQVSVPVQMWRWFLKEPLCFLELQFRKALLFWDGREIPNNVSLLIDGCRFSRILRWLLPGRSAFLLALAVAGLLLAFPRRDDEKRWEKLLLYGWVGCFWVAVTVFYLLSRFRAPILPFLYLFTGAGMVELVRRFRGGRRPALTALLALLFGVWLVNAAYDNYRSFEPAIWRFLRPDGICLDLPGTTVQYFDHGPRPFGGWSGIQLAPGTVLTKKWCGPGIASGTLTVHLLNWESADITFRINGRDFSVLLPSLQPGKEPWRSLSFPAFFTDGTIQVEISALSGGPVWVLADYQRDYGRSAVNGAVIPAELVFRAAIPRFH